MGGAPSRISYEERKVRLRNLDKENAGIQSKINEIIPIKNQLDQQVNSMKGELAQLNTDITQLGKDITTNIDTRTDLTGKKEGLEKDLESAEYLLKSVEQAIDEIKKYGNLQKRTQDFFDNEYEVLYTKIVARQLLKQDDYINVFVIS